MLKEIREKYATFNKGESKAQTGPGIVAEAERAGEKEERDANALLKAAIRPRERAASGKALDRLDVVYESLLHAQDDVSTMATAAEQAEEARRHFDRSVGLLPAQGLPHLPHVARECRRWSLPGGAPGSGPAAPLEAPTLSPSADTRARRLAQHVNAELDLGF